MVMKPNPPIWIMVMMTIWPKRLHCVQVSATTSPVTQEALVAVNRAPRKSIPCLLLLETGSITLSGTGAELLANDKVKEAYLGKTRQ